MQYSQILWAVLYGSLFFGETPDRATAIGAFIPIFLIPAAIAFYLMRQAG